MSNEPACIFDVISCLDSRRKLNLMNTVKSDVLEAVDVFLSNDENNEKIYLDYSTKAGMMPGIWARSGTMTAKAVKGDRSKLLRARLVLDDDVRCNSYFSSRSAWINKFQSIVFKYQRWSWHRFR